MVTLEQAKEYLESQGITIPDFVLQALVDQANSIQECLDAHYPASTALLIQLYLLALTLSVTNPLNNNIGRLYDPVEYTGLQYL